MIPKNIARGALIDDLLDLHASPKGRLNFRFANLARHFAGHCGAVRAPRLKLSRQHRHQWIVAQRLMVIEVLVAERDPEYPLPNQRRH